MIKNIISKTKKDEKGSTLVEFSILFVPLMTVIMGLTELGYQAYLNMMTQSVSHRIAREATVGTSTQADVEDLANELLSPVLLNGANVDITTSSYFDFAGIGQPETITNDINSNDVVEEGDCFDDVNGNASHDTDLGQSGLGGADDVVTYTITIDSPQLLGVAGFLGFSDRLNISATSASRNQPFEEQTPLAIQRYCIVGGVSVAF